MRDRAALITECVPEGAFFISAENPLLIERLFDGTVHVIPSDRFLNGKEIEFAGKVLMWRPPECLPKLRETLINWSGENQRQLLLNCGGEEIYRDTVTSAPQNVQSLLKSGRSVFVDLKSVDQVTRDSILHGLTFKECRDGIGHLLP